MDIIISSATHRSGSTLVQRIFNLRKETLIWGEQDGLLTDFYRINKKLMHYSVDLRQQRLNYFNHNEDPNHWIACMNPEEHYVEKATIESIKVFLSTLYQQYSQNHDRIGFKEVRYGEKELSLFRACYPDAKIVLLVRNPIHVWQSMLGAGLGHNIERFTKKWEKHASEYLELQKNDPNAYLIKYEDIVNNDPKTIETLCQLGDLSPEEISTVTSRKISSTPRELTEEHKNIILENCGEVMKKYHYI